MSDDYFASQPVAVLPRRETDGASVRPRRRIRRPIGAAVVVSCVVVGVVIALPSGAKGRPADRRPLAIPGSLAGLPLLTDVNAQTHSTQMEPILTKMFGANASESAVYGDRLPLIYVLAGRGSMSHSTGDVHLTAPDHRIFGDVTCADMALPDPTSGSHRNVDVPSLEVCWYSSPNFSASVLFGGSHPGDSAAHAAALDAVLPILENNAS